MPGVYREKVCPTCGVKHRKKGPFCSKACSNAGRDAETRQKLSDASKANNNIANAMIATGVSTEPPDPNNWGIFSLEQNQFIDRDGDIWTTFD
jgi:endogenous inhibitor of DNA gyrase (YacG/DUF329 family)